MISAAAGTDDPPPVALLFIFWTAFAAAVIAVRMLSPEMFQRFDPDSLMRLVQVRDLLNGQAWFDLVQHRLDPPDGVLMHWSRLVDAPIAGLVMVGNLFGLGEAFALTVWPLALLLLLMGSSLGVAMALGGRAAAAPTLILSLVFFDPMLSYLPGDIDHHNLQLALMAAMLACALRIERPFFGLAAGAVAALSLSVGLEMIPWIAVAGFVVATRWALGGDQLGKSVALFGLALGTAPTLLYLAFGSPAAATACDALSYAYALPAAIAGLGLAAVVRLAGKAGRALRFTGLALAAAGGGAVFAAFFPDCLAGPYGSVAPEAKALWLSTITEAQPVAAFAAHEPVGMIATLGPPAVALAVALVRLRREGPGSVWLLPALFIAVSLAMGFYQVRTLPLANAIAIPVLAAWLAAERRRTCERPTRLGRAAPMAAAFLLALPAFHLALGWAAVRAASLASGGRVAPIVRPDAPKAEIAALSPAEKDCVDASSAALFATAPPGLVIAPVFFGSAVLVNSAHSVVGAPYHRGDAAIVDSIRATDLPPAEARAIVMRRGADYLAICATSQETAITAAEAPGGLLAVLMAGRDIDWLEPVGAPQPTSLRLWRVRLQND